MDPQVGDLKSIGLPIPLHRYTHTYTIYRHTPHTPHTSSLQMWFILLAHSFFKILNLLTTHYKNMGFKFLLQKSEHLALLHPNFSIATIRWSCRHQPSGVQPWLHNRITWGAFSKIPMPKPHSRPIKPPFPTVAAAANVDRVQLVLSKNVLWKESWYVKDIQVGDTKHVWKWW